MIRYPGSKDKIYHEVMLHFPEWVRYPLWARDGATYCEPFFGSGAIGRRIFNQYPKKKLRVCINDIDPGVAALWVCVRDIPNRLSRLILEFVPSVQAFQEFQASDGGPGKSSLQQAFEKLVLHQTSFSGLGYMAGGPIGGVKQRSDYNVDCRWSPARLISSIRKTHRTFKAMLQVEITSVDFEYPLRKLGENDFAYLDPPYFVQGPNLYKFGMGDQDDHHRLANILRSAVFDWVLSYDNHDYIRDLYSWANVVSFETVATVATVEGGKLRDRKNNELIITPKRRGSSTRVLMPL